MSQACRQIFPVIGIRAGKIEHLGIEMPFHAVGVELYRTGCLDKVGVTGSIPAVPTTQSCRTGYFSVRFKSAVCAGISAIGSALYRLCGSSLSLAAILAALSPHPKIPFLADKAQRLTSGSCRTEARPRRRHQRCFWSVAIVADSTQVLRTADSILPEHRAAARC